MPSSSSSATSLALRSSCDRCRAHKLKCSGAAGWKPNFNSNSSETPIRPCDRCLRAKADCVFGRRAQTGRPPSCPSSDVDSKASISSATPSLSSRSTASYRDGASTPNSLSIDSDAMHDRAAPAFTYDPHYFELDADFPMDMSFDDFTIDPNWSWNNVDGGASSASLSHCDIDPFAQPTPTWAPCSQGLGLTLECPPKPDSPQSHVLRLSTLLADTIRTSDELSNAAWKATHISSLEALSQYPIGGVLHLAHQFRAIHADIAQVYGDGSASPTHSALTVSVSKLFSNPAVDMSSRCIVLSCHISLVKLYGIVFRDLENIVETLPSSPAHAQFFSSDHLATPTTDPLSNLRLFELPSTSEARSKIFTAVSMLLRAFPPSEMTLGALQDVAAAGQHCAPVANMGQDALLCNSAIAVRNESDRAIAHLQSLERLLLRKAEH